MGLGRKVCKLHTLCNCPVPRLGNVTKLRISALSYFLATATARGSGHRGGKKLVHFHPPPKFTIATYSSGVIQSLHLFYIDIEC